MIDWKILAGGVVALMFVSTMFLGGIGKGGFGDFFSGLFDSISAWFGSSPLGGLLPSSTKESTKVSFIIYSKNFTLEPSTAFSAAFGNAEVESFKGSITTGEKITLSSSDTTIKVNGPVQIAGLSIKSLKLESAKFDIMPNATADSGSLEISNFLGTAVVGPENITFEGNVTKLVANIGGLNWQLV